MFNILLFPLITCFLFLLILWLVLFRHLLSFDSVIHTPVCSFHIHDCSNALCLSNFYSFLLVMRIQLNFWDRFLSHSFHIFVWFSLHFLFPIFPFFCTVSHIRLTIFKLHIFFVIFVMPIFSFLDISVIQYLDHMVSTMFLILFLLIQR